MEMVNLSLTEAYALAYKVLRGNGFSEAHAVAIATNVTHGERDGCASHGLWRLLGIVETRRKGKVSPDAEPVITDTAPAIVKVDAGGAFSLLAFERALPLLIEKARHSGIAALAINRCVHFSALFADVEPLTEAGLVALATTPSHAWVAPAGGTQPLFGTNPIAFGWPREEKPRLSSTWPPVRRHGERSNSINGREKRCRKGGGLTVTVRPPPTRRRSSTVRC